MEKLCKNCKWRDEGGFCVNEGKIYEDGYGRGGRDSSTSDDCLIYSFYEGGDFWVGENFGCVHFKEKTK